MAPATLPRPLPVVTATEGPLLVLPVLPSSMEFPRALGPYRGASAGVFHIDGCVTERSQSTLSDAGRVGRADQHTAHGGEGEVLLEN